MYSDLNEKQIKVLEFIKKQLKHKGYPPSVREIGYANDIKSTSTVHAYLNKLEEAGYIRKDQSKPRAIEIVSSTNDNFCFISDVINIPVLKGIIALDVLLKKDNINQYVPISLEFIDCKDCFIVKSPINSRKHQINIGDFLLIQQFDKYNNIHSTNKPIIILDKDNVIHIKDDINNNSHKFIGIIKSLLKQF